MSGRPRKLAERYYSPAGVAERQGLSIWTVRRWCKDRDLRHMRIGNTIRIREDDLACFLAANERDDIETVAGRADLD